MDGTEIPPLITLPPANPATYQRWNTLYNKYLKWIKAGNSPENFRDPEFDETLRWIRDQYSTGNSSNRNFRPPMPKPVKSKSTEDKRHLAELKRLIARGQSASAAEVLNHSERYFQYKDEPVPPIRAGILLMPSPQELSREDFINLSVFPILPLGMMTGPSRVDGADMTPGDLWNHDLQHSRAMAKGFPVANGIEAIEREISTRSRCACHLFSNPGSSLDKGLKALWFTMFHEDSQTPLDGSVPHAFLGRLLRAKADLMRPEPRGTGMKFSQGGIFGDSPLAQLPEDARNSAIEAAYFSAYQTISKLDGSCRSKGEEEFERKTVPATQKQKACEINYSLVAQAQARSIMSLTGIEQSRQASIALKNLSPAQQEQAVNDTLTYMGNSPRAELVALSAKGVSIAPGLISRFLRFGSGKVGGAIGGTMVPAAAFAHDYPENPQHYMDVEGANRCATKPDICKTMLVGYPEMAEYFELLHLRAKNGHL